MMALDPLAPSGRPEGPIRRFAYAGLPGARAGLLVAMMAIAPLSAWAQDASGRVTQSGGPQGSGGTLNPQSQDRRLWFDPTQLPSFNGTVERYLINPEGQIDRLIFREGPQILLPGPVGTEVMAAVPVGKDITVWGIRARQAPAITMLAWAPDRDAPPRFVERPSWGVTYHAGTQVLQVEGDVAAPLYTPQGASMGVILTDGSAVHMPPAVAQALGDKIAVGRRIAVSGRGVRSDRGTAIDAEKLGDTLQALQPLPAGQKP